MKSKLVKKYIGDAAFYRMALAVALPIMVQNGITQFVGLLDNIMVGQVGQAQMSGVGIANQLVFVFNLMIFGAVAQLEREYLLQRQKEGIAIAKQEGKYKGRKPLERTEQDAVIASWRNGEISTVEAMRTLQMSKTTFYRRVNQIEGRERP